MLLPSIVRHWKSTLQAFGRTGVISSRKGDDSPAETLRERAGVRQ